jgi:hypothetical protein
MSIVLDLHDEGRGSACWNGSADELCKQQTHTSQRQPSHLILYQYMPIGRHVLYLMAA